MVCSLTDMAKVETPPSSPSVGEKRAPPPRPPRGLPGAQPRGAGKDVWPAAKVWDHCWGPCPSPAPPAPGGRAPRAGASALGPRPPQVSRVDLAVGTRLRPCLPQSDWSGGWTGGTWWWRSRTTLCWSQLSPSNLPAWGSSLPSARGQPSEVSPGRGLVQMLALPPSSYVQVTS